MEKLQQQQTDDILSNENYKTYLCSYNFKGHEWGFDIPARSLEEAQQRLKSIGCNGWVDGELVCRVPLPIKENWLRKIISFFKGV